MNIIHLPVLLPWLGCAGSRHFGGDRHLVPNGPDQRDVAAQDLPGSAPPATPGRPVADRTVCLRVRIADPVLGQVAAHRRDHRADVGGPARVLLLPGQGRLA